MTFKYTIFNSLRTDFLSVAAQYVLMGLVQLSQIKATLEPQPLMRKFGQKSPVACHTLTCRIALHSKPEENKAIFSDALGWG